MKPKRALGIAGFIAITGACVWAGSQEDMGKAFQKLWPEPWFKVTMLDLYLGLLIMAFFMWQNKHSRLEKLLWTAAFLGLGNIATLAYLTRYTLKEKS